MSSFNIALLAAAATHPIHLKSADGQYLYHDGKPVRIVIHGPGSDAFSEVEDRQIARTLKRRADNDGKMTAAPADQRAAEQADDLASLTVSFENFDYPLAAGKTGKDLFRALYSDRSLGFIAAQVQKAVGDWGNFSPTPTSVSPSS